MSQSLTEIWKQQVIVDNRPGAATNIGTDMAAHAPADGYTLLLTNNALAIGAGLYPKLTYNALTDLAPITQILASPFVLVVPASSPAKTVSELVALAKAKPGEIAYGSAGVGSGPHLAGVLFTSMTKTSINHVPYKSGGSVLPDLIAGRVQMLFTTPLAAMPHVQSGRLRALAVTTAKRSPTLPQLPTLAEAGVAGYDVTTWYMLLAPSKTPIPVIEKIQKDVASLLNQPGVIKVLGSEGADLIGSAPQEAALLLKREVALWSKVIKEAGVKPTD